MRISTEHFVCSNSAFLGAISIVNSILSDKQAFVVVYVDFVALFGDDLEEPRFTPDELWIAMSNHSNVELKYMTNKNRDKDKFCSSFFRKQGLN